jgi:hypothetical protein
VSLIRKYIQTGLPALALGALLAACGGQPASVSQPTLVPETTAAAIPTSAPQPTAQPAPTSAPEPTRAPAPTAAPIPTSVPEPTATPAPTAELFYVDQNKVYAQPIGGAARQVADIPGEVLDAAVAGDMLLVLRAEGLVRVDLPNGTSTTVAKFKAPARAGSRLLATRDAKIFYAAWMDDPDKAFGNTQIGYYDVAAANVKPLILVDGGAAPLGLTPNGDGMYLLPLGGDPAFVRIQVVDLASGKVRADLAVEGEGMPVVSPDGRFLVTTARRFSASDPNAEPDSLLYLYDLTAQAPKARVITPPKAPSAATYPFWAPDSSAFYFALGTGNIYELKDSYGLWSYSVAADKAAQVADVNVLNSFFAEVNPAGQVLQRQTMQASSQLVDLASGKPTPFAIAPNAIVAGWR